MEAEAAKEKEAVEEQMQHLTTQNTTLAELVKTQQKKIDELLETSKKLFAAMQLQRMPLDSKP